MTGILTGIVNLADLVAGVADAVAVDFGAAGIAITTTAGTPASPSLAIASAEDSVVQALASASGGMAVLTGKPALKAAFAASSYLLSGAGFATAVQLINAAEAAAQKPPSAEDIATIKGAFVETIGDSCAMLSALAAIANARLNLPALKIAGKLLSIAGAVFSGYGLVLTKEANPDSTILTALNKQITGLQTALTNNSAALTQAFGPTWGTIATDVANAFGSALAVVNNNDNTTILASATSALSVFSTVGSDLSGLFSASGSASQTITETAGASGPTTATAADGSFTETGSLNVNTALSTSSISDNFVIASEGSAAFSNSLIATAGSWMQFSSDTAGSIVAATTLAADSTGATQQQTVFNGTTITTPSSVTAEVAFDAAGLPVIDIPWQSLLDEILVQRNADGTDQIFLSTGGTTTPQQIADFSAGGLIGDTIGLTQNNSGSLDVSVGIGGGDSAVLLSDGSLSNVIQNFDFLGSSGTLMLDSPSSFVGTISNFQAGNTIALAGVGVGIGATFSGNGLLKLYDSSGGSVSLNLDPTGTYSGESFLISPDGSGGSEIVGVGPRVSFSDAGQTLLIPSVSAANAIYNFQPGDTIDLAGVAPSNILQDESGYIGVDIAGPNNSSSFVGISGGNTPITASIVPDGNGGSKIVASLAKRVTYTYTGNAFNIEPANAIFTPKGFLPGSASASITFNIPIGYTSTGAPGGGWPYSYYSQVGNILEPSLVDWSVTFGGTTYEWYNPNTGGYNYNVSDSGFRFGLSFVNGQLYGSALFEVLTPGTVRDQIAMNITPSFDYAESFAYAPVYGYVAGESTIPGTWAITSVTDIPCYAEGTRILTPCGDVQVELLTEGNVVVTHDGRAVPVQWIGHRHVDCRRHPKPEKVWPVRVAAGAFSKYLPRRDLWLSPDHAVYIDGVLIPIRYLVNGRTIIQEPRDEVTYWHVELEQHDVILAEGLPCESYLDTGNRAAFTNCGASVHMHADFALRVWDTAACAPLVRDGAELEAARSWLLERATLLGHAMTRDPALRLIAAGRELKPECRGRVWRFRVPASATTVRLLSRSAVPAFIRFDCNDPRRLGVAVSRVVYGGQEIPLTDPRLGAGWHDAEYDGEAVAWRWTNGEAELALPGRLCILEIEVALTHVYWVDDQPTIAEPPAFAAMS